MFIIYWQLLASLQKLHLSANEHPKESAQRTELFLVDIFELLLSTTFNCFSVSYPK